MVDIVQVLHFTLYVIVVFLILKLLLTHLFGNVFNRIYRWFNK
jgi:hypothetical protein